MDASNPNTPNTRETWKLIVDVPLNGSLNMAVDHYLLSRIANRHFGPTTFLRLYQWDRPTLSLGISQKPERIVDFEYCRRNGIDVVRRLTGGKAVLHHRELTYAVISNDTSFFPTNDIGGTYHRIAIALQAGLRTLGLAPSLSASQPRRRQNPSKACFATLNHHEITVSGRKLVGSAQRRTGIGFLQHGSIPFAFDINHLAGALRLKDDDGIKSRVTDLRSCLDDQIRISDTVAAIIAGFEISFDVRLAEVALQAGEWQAVRSTFLCKYENLSGNLLPKLP